MKKFLVFFVACVLFLSNSRAFAKPMNILFIPIDDRPVSLSYVVDVVKNTDIKLLTPPEKYLSGINRVGNPHELNKWLLTNAKKVDAIVLSTDSLIYGGLVPSRTHNERLEVLLQRIESIKNIKKQNPRLDIYAFSSMMRTPRASVKGLEPDYYEIYGPQIFRLTQLNDKEEIMGLTNSEFTERKNLARLVPEAHLSDWLNRRKTNLSVHLRLAELVRNKIFEYYLIGKDDNAPWSQTHMEVRHFQRQTQDISSAYMDIVPGIDQIGMLLLARAKMDDTLQRPYVYATYSEGVGTLTVPTYSDQKVLESVDLQIRASGALSAFDEQHSRIILAVNTPFDGRTLETAHMHNLPYTSRYNVNFVTEIEKNIKEGRDVAIADIAFANGSDNGFMEELARRNMFGKIDTYSGWNTADNSIGFAIAQTLLLQGTTRLEKDQVIKTRIIDDWIYQANVREYIVKDYLYQDPSARYNLGKNAQKIEKIVDNEIHKKAEQYAYLKNFKFRATLPWERLFEVKIATV